MSTDMYTRLDAFKRDLAEKGDAGAWSKLWILGAIDLTAMISGSEDIAHLALGAFRDPELRGMTPSIHKNLREPVEEAEEDVITPTAPFMSPQSDSTNALICVVSVYISILVEMGEEHAFRDGYDALICVKRPTSKRVLRWLEAEAQRRGRDWPPARRERDYPALCAELV